MNFIIIFPYLLVLFFHSIFSQYEDESSFNFTSTNYSQISNTRPQHTSNKTKLINRKKKLKLELQAISNKIQDVNDAYEKEKNNKILNVHNKVTLKRLKSKKSRLLKKKKKKNKVIEEVEDELYNIVVENREHLGI